MHHKVKEGLLSSVLDKIINFKNSYLISVKQLLNDIYSMIWLWNFILEAEVIYFLLLIKATVKQLQ